MSRQWKVWSDWSGGGFFAGGSFGARDRHNSLNMQRYINGSIGPRPGWRKLTQTNFGTAPDAVPSVSNANRATLQYGAGWVPYGGYIVLVGTGSGGPSKRINIGSTGGAEYRDAADVGYHAISATNILGSFEAAQINSFQPQINSNQYAAIGPNMYHAQSDALSSITARTLNALAFYPSQSVFYKGRMYSWRAINAQNVE